VYFVSFHYQNRNYVCDLSFPNIVCAQLQWFTNHRHQNRRSGYNSWVTATLLLYIQQTIAIDKAACHSQIILPYQYLDPYIRGNYGLSHLRRSYGRPYFRNLWQRIRRNEDCVGWFSIKISYRGQNHERDIFWEIKKCRLGIWERQLTLRRVHVTIVAVRKQSVFL